VYGLPENFKRPKDLFDDKEVLRAQLYNNTSNKDSKKAWIVYSDRDDNPIYESRNENSQKVGTMNFRDQFYVVKEEDNWIRIADCKLVSSDRLKIRGAAKVLGWVPKSKMLLWSSGLIDKRTRINKKAFLLNRADDINNVLNRKADYKELIVDFHRHPRKDKIDGEKKIYSYYFILKRENERLLLAEEAELSQYNLELNLLGWVNERRVQYWNTRMSLEANFDEHAFNERTAYDKFSIKLFGDEFALQGCVEKNQCSNPYSDADPANYMDELAKDNNTCKDDSDKRRFKGDVMRYPLFSQGKVGKCDFFRTGAIGSIKVLQGEGGKVRIKPQSDIQELNHAKLKFKVSELNEKANNVNILFLVEGSKNMLTNKGAILNSISSLRQNRSLESVNGSVKYGVVMYKDIPEGRNMLKYKELTQNLDDVKSFIESYSFSDMYDKDDYTTFYHGLKNGINLAKFSKNATNIVIMLGNGGDYYADTSRRKKAKDEGERTLVVDKNPMYEDLSGLDIHLFGIQLNNNGTNAGRAYAYQIHNFVLQNAQVKHIKMKDSSTGKSIVKQLKLDYAPIFDYQSPTLSQPSGFTDAALMGSSPGRIICPAKGQSVSSSNLTKYFNESVTSSIAYQQAIANSCSRMVNDGNTLHKDGALSIPTWSHGIVQILSEMIDNTDNRTIGVTEPNLSVYADVCLPKQYQGARHPTYSYVLFMPEQDLVDYKNKVLSKFLAASETASYAEKRKNLIEIHKGLIEQFAGDKVFSKKKPEEFTRLELFRLIQGLEEEGFEHNIESDFIIEDLKSRNKVSDDDIDKLLKGFTKIYKNIESIYRDRDYYFSFRPDDQNRYFWLRIDQVFYTGE